MCKQTEYEMLLEKKCEIDNRIDNLVGDMDIFPDVYEEYGVGAYEWSPRNETKVLWAEKISGDIGELKARKRKINNRLRVLKRQGCRPLNGRHGHK